MNPVKTAIIGLGYFGPNLLRNFAAQPNCLLRYACDLRKDVVEKTQRSYPNIQCIEDTKNIFTDPEIELVIIATPTASHFSLAKETLASGKHVLIEKPITATIAEAEELVKLAKEKQKMIFVDHTFCFAPAVQKMSAMAKSGALGDLLYFDSVRINLGLIQKDSNVLQDLAIHDLSILSQIIDLREIESACAHGSKHFGEHEENAHIHLTSKSGFTAHIHVSWLSPVKVRRTMLAGTKSMLLYDDTEPSEKIRIYDRGVDYIPKQRADLPSVASAKEDPFFPKYRSGDILIPALTIGEPLAIEAQHILHCIRSGEKPIVSGDDALRVLKLLSVCMDSLKKDSSVLPAQ